MKKKPKSCWGRPSPETELGQQFCAFYAQAHLDELLSNYGFEIIHKPRGKEPYVSLSYKNKDEDNLIVDQIDLSIEPLFEVFPKGGRKVLMTAIRVWGTIGDDAANSYYAEVVELEADEPIDEIFYCLEEIIWNNKKDVDKTLVPMETGYEDWD